MNVQQHKITKSAYFWFLDDFMVRKNASNVIATQLKSNNKEKKYVVEQFPLHSWNWEWVM